MSDPIIPCACARPGDGAHAVAVDPEIKRAVLTRLRRIEGQVRGLQKMVEEERYCADVLIQVSLADMTLESMVHAFNQVETDIGDVGVTRTLNQDIHGKSLSSSLLEMELPEQRP